MKKINIRFIVMQLAVLLPLASFADSTGGCGSATICNPISNVSNFSDFVTQITSIIGTIGAVVVTIFIIYSGFLFVTAQGKPEDLKKAKAAFTWTLVGAAVLLGATALATAITATVQNF